MVETQRFSYRAPRSQALLIVPAALAIPLALAYAAASNRKGLRLLGLLTFSPRAASTLYWLLAAAALLAAVVAIRLALQSLHWAGYLELGPTAAVLPIASVSQAPLSIPYESVSSVRCVDLPGQQMLVVTARLGEARLLSKSFASPAEFAAFARAIQNRVNG